MELVAWLGLLAAVGTAVFTYLTYRAGRLNIECYAELTVRHETPYPPYLDTRTVATIQVNNRGAVPVTVKAVEWRRTPGNVQAELVSAPSPPWRLDGNDDMTLILSHPGVVHDVPALVIAGRLRRVPVERVLNIVP